MVADLLARIPEPALPEVDVSDSVAYLASDAALRSIAADVYWPKWDSPWWHALLLWELGAAERIPQRTVRALVDGLNAYPVKIFPIHEGDASGYDPRRDIACHCSLGCISQVLHACGVDVGRELPWIKPWFVTYQMPDGGMNCDETAYRAEGECPSSMVGTIAAFEAMQLLAQAPEERAFVERAARFLVERRLVLGSPTKHNAEERSREPSWRQL